MSRHDQIFSPHLPPEDCRRQVHGIERAERQGQRGGGPFENTVGNLGDRNAIKQLVDRFPASNDLRGSESPLKVQAIERPEAFHLDERAAHPFIDLLPLRQSIRFPEDQPQENGGIEVGDHRRSRRSLSNAERLSTGVPTGEGSVKS